MSESSVPRTPTPDDLRKNSTSPCATSSCQEDGIKGERLQSAPNLTSLITPASASNTVSKSQSKFFSRMELSLASPPPTIRTGPPISSGTLYGEVPSVDNVHKMGEDQLRSLVLELLPALGEARVTAAHSKLQHTLLTIEKEESAKRAEVEHDATRRECQVLQEASPISNGAFSPMRSPSMSMQRSLHLALNHCRELQQDNAKLHKRLKASRKFICQLDGRNADLKDDNQRLRQRIKDNRDHITDLQESGALSIHTTPQHDYATPHHRSTPKTPINRSSLHDLASKAMSSQNPFDALLQASHVLNGQTNSVPSSPQQSRPKRAYPQHMRGALSLSSLPTTPERRPVTGPTISCTPGNQYEHHGGILSIPGNPSTTYVNDLALARQDRESTISASDNEEDEIPGSQASQMAASMLRRRLESHDDQDAPSLRSAPGSTLKQARLFGHVTKPAPGNSGQKRGAEYEEPHTVKKLKNQHQDLNDVGLGINSWLSPA